MIKKFLLKVLNAQEIPAPSAAPANTADWNPYKKTEVVVLPAAQVVEVIEAAKIDVPAPMFSAQLVKKAQNKAVAILTSGRVLIQRGQNVNDREYTSSEVPGVVLIQTRPKSVSHSWSIRSVSGDSKVFSRSQAEPIEAAWAKLVEGMMKAGTYDHHFDMRDDEAKFLDELDVPSPLKRC